MPQPRVVNVTVPDHMLSISELHEMAITHAEDHFGRKGEIPFLWLLDLGHQILWIETPWADDLEKEACVRIMQMIMRESKTRAYVQMIEAYMATAKANGDPFIMPSQRPKSERDDVMMVMSCNKVGDQIVTRYLVTVRKGKKLNFLGPRDDWNMEDGHFEGFMFNLLKKSEKCQACGLLIGHKDGCVAPMVAQMFTEGRV